MSKKIYIGTSGFVYDHWKKVFYPENLTKSKWLSFYCQYFNTVELNVTFYRLPKKETFDKWNEGAPKDFSFVLKGPRLITHYKKLTNSKESLSLFFKTIKPLQGKIKIILWQFPSNMKYDKEKFQKFVGLLNKDFRYAFEFRNRSWFNEETYQMIKKSNSAIVECDWPFFISEQEIINKEEFIKIPKLSDFVYIRRHGATALYSLCYSKDQLKKDAQAIKKTIKDNRDCFAYFNNDAEGNAVKNAQELKNLIQK